MLRLTRQPMSDGRYASPSTERNRGPILEVLERLLPEQGLVLEIASGTGEHVVHFARARPALAWQPSDPDPEHLKSIRAWVAHEGLTNVREPIDFDVQRRPWPVDRADAVLCINMIHVAPWPATRDLFEGARDVLATNGLLFLYGPYRRYGAHTSPGNAAFDVQLRATDPAWGLRDMEDVVATGERAGFALVETVAMPANNFSLAFRKR